MVKSVKKAQPEPKLTPYAAWQGEFDAELENTGMTPTITTHNGQLRLDRGTYEWLCSLTRLKGIEMMQHLAMSADLHMIPLDTLVKKLTMIRY